MISFSHRQAFADGSALSQQEAVAATRAYPAAAVLPEK
jgi:hypothetical protein